MSETPLSPLSEAGKEETYRVEGVDTPNSTSGDSGHFELHDRSGSKDPQSLWRSYLEFVQFSLGFSANLGTIWRFPYVLLSSSGGAFLIAYFVCLLLIGMPLFFLESVIGQTSGLSATRVFTMVPIFQGIGFCMMASCSVISIYYSVIMTWTIYYFGMSFQWYVPWSTCGNSWNTKDCCVYNDID
ncbi:hypothetical protein T265_14044, partial [Opisthorchis viverrini]